ncbi:MAG: hypothetical protein M3011_07690, partial [Actinomycetota bacterium]|nr:hypothetical protein [Actinomycetota bacterium]
SGRAVAGPGGKPVMLATNGAIPRLAWDTFDHQRWLLPARDDLGAMTDRLADGGVDQVVLVTAHLPEDLAAVGPRAQVLSDDHPTGHGTWHVLVLRLR